MSEHKPGDKVIVVGTFERNEFGNLDVDFGLAIGSLYMGELGDYDVPQFPLPLDDATVERLARAAYEAEIQDFLEQLGVTDVSMISWERSQEVIRHSFRVKVRAVIDALIEDNDDSRTP